MALFALPFLAGGGWVAKSALAPILFDAYRMQSWHEGEARLTSAGVAATVGEDSTTYRALATYTYEYGGRQYSGDRVAIAGGADNLGDFQETLGETLRRAYESGRPVPVWINPGDPREAALNRDLRWELLALFGVLVLISAVVGFALLRHALRPRRAVGLEAGQTPWLARAEWTTPEIRCGARRNVWAAWILAVVWNLIAIPVGVVTTFEFLDGNRPAILGLLFPLAGIGLFAWALKQTLSWRRFGSTLLTLDPFPGATGGQVGGTMDVRVSYDATLRFRTTLSCLYSYVSGTGKNRRRRERAIWQSEGLAHTRSASAGTRLEILFDVDAGLPSSDIEHSGDYHLWKLKVEAELPGVDFERSFEIPVFPTAARARRLNHLATEHPMADELRASEIASVLDMRPIAGGAELHFPALRKPGAKLAGVVFGGLLLGVAALTGQTDIPNLMRVLFGVVGGAVMLASIYHLLLEMRVRIDSSQVEIRKRWLGLPVGGERLPRSDVRALTLKRSYSSVSGDRHVIWFKLLAVTRDERAVTIGYNLAGRETALQALRALSERTGIAAADLPYHDGSRR